MEYSFDRDIKDIAPLWLLMVNEVDPEATPNIDWWFGLTKTLKESDNYVVITAEKDGKIIGFCDGLLFNDPLSGKKTGMGQHFYVLPEYRETAIAEKLYKDCDSKLIEMGAEAIELQCYKEKERFWGRAGYESIRTIMRRTV